MGKKLHPSERHCTHYLHCRGYLSLFRRTPESFPQCFGPGDWIRPLDAVVTDGEEVVGKKEITVGGMALRAMRHNLCVTFDDTCTILRLTFGRGATFLTGEKKGL